MIYFSRNILEFFVLKKKFQSESNFEKKIKQKVNSSLNCVYTLLNEFTAKNTNRAKTST